MCLFMLLAHLISLYWLLLSDPVLVCSHTEEHLEISSCLTLAVHLLWWIWFQHCSCLLQWRQTSLYFKKLFRWEVVSLRLWLFKLSWSALLILYGRKCWDTTDCVSSLAGAGFSTIFWHKISFSFTLMLSPGHAQNTYPVVMGCSCCS